MGRGTARGPAWYVPRPPLALQRLSQGEDGGEHAQAVLEGDAADHHVRRPGTADAARSRDPGHGGVLRDGQDIEPEAEADQRGGAVPPRECALFEPHPFIPGFIPETRSHR